MRNSSRERSKIKVINILIDFVLHVQVAIQVIPCLRV